MSEMTKAPLVFLLPIWGEHYIKHFFNYSLRTLLAPGNLPEMSKQYDCTFLFLTKSENFSYFKTFPAYKTLESYCTVEFLDISDLLFWSYSTTLTLAYDRGMKSRGKKMCETFFFYLVADLIYADNSFGNLIPYLEKGYSGVTSGNFLVIEETFTEYCDQQDKWIFDSRELLKIAFKQIHPISIGQTLTQNFVHTDHANRFFWKVDQEVMIGRFYLRHMLCIKPEIENYVIGASCDYSFIPELCPSGNVFAIQDSDLFCMVEMAPHNYDEGHVKKGALSIKAIVKNLSEWTTSHHRANAHLPVVFHSRPLDKPPEESIQASNQVIQKIESALPKKPAPHRGHQYWLHALDSTVHQILHHKERNPEATPSPLFSSPTFLPKFGREEDERYLIDRFLAPLPFQICKKEKMRKFLTNSLNITSLPYLDRFDHNELKGGLQSVFNPHAPSIIIALEPIESIFDWVDRVSSTPPLYQYYEFFKQRSSEELKTLLVGREQAIILLSKNWDPFLLAKTLHMCAKHMSPGSSITLCTHYKEKIKKKKFNTQSALLSALLDLNGVVCEKQQLQYSFAQMYLRRLYYWFIDLSFEKRSTFLNRPFGYMGLVFLNIACLFGNCLSRIGMVPKKYITGALLVFKSRR